MIEANTGPSVYDLNAPLYIARGARPVPIEPGTKRPSIYGNGAGYKPMQHWTTRSPVTAPQPGAGIGIVCGETFSAIDIDCDDEMRTAIEKVIPESLIGKRGRRGATWFYRGGNRRSRKFLVNGRTVCEV